MCIYIYTNICVYNIYVYYVTPKNRNVFFLFGLLDMCRYSHVSLDFPSYQSHLRSLFGRFGASDAFSEGLWNSKVYQIHPYAIC